MYAPRHVERTDLGFRIVATHRDNQAVDCTVTIDARTVVATSYVATTESYELVESAAIA